jgi:DNA-binding SARP family transcriptional activator/DNA-binding NarL/FixJ family response regulator
MEIWVLGTLEVSHDGRAVDVRGSLPRRLLALLALTPGQEVGTDSLVEQMWGADAPPAASSTLQSHVARLRRALPMPDVVRTGRHGYGLDIAPEAIDAHRFEVQVAQASTALMAGKVDAASGLLTEALQLWRGTPYAEFVGSERLEAEAARLGELRLDALERRISADLGRAGTGSPIAELEALVRWHPLRESFWALLMAAHYRAGRQADALGAYRRARGVLADELGVDPGPQLQELERLVLAQDPSLETSSISSFLPTPARPAVYSDDVALVERSELVETLAAQYGHATTDGGRLVLLHGDAGAGKSALIRTWATSVPDGVPMLVGACDPLSSPRPLGPLVDISSGLDPTVGQLLREGDKERVFDAALHAITELGPAVVVVEDVHWADMATLDFLRFLARRIERTHALVIATYRDDDLTATNPLRIMLGDIGSSPSVTRLAVPPLSRDAVAELVAGRGLDVDRVMAETGGNAFFVSEVVASGGDHLPATVQDAVLARMNRLSPQARLALESAAVIGSRIEPSLIHGMPDVSPDAVDECVTAGMLEFAAPTYVFRHEIVRQAVLSAITPGRLGALHWQALDRLRGLPMSPRPWARLAEHAEMAGDPPAILEYAIAAGDAAVALGSHREAAYQFGRAMPYLELLDVDARIDLLGKRGRECSICDQHDESIDAHRRQIALLRDAGDRELEIVDALLAVDFSFFTIGDNSHGTEFVDEAFALLDEDVATPQLARALSTRAAHYARASQALESLPWYERALEVGRISDERSVVARALASRGAMRVLVGDAAGQADVEEALQYALDNDLSEMASRLFQTLAWVHWSRRQLDESVETYDLGAQYSEDHDLNGDMLCALASSVTVKLEMGRWDDAIRESDELLYVRNTGRASRIEPLSVLALVGARRGDRDDVWELLDEMRDWIAKSQTLDYQGSVAVARGEVHLLDGDLGQAEALVRPWFDVAVRLQEPDWMGRLSLLLMRIGALTEPPPGLREPEVWSMTGEHRRAADHWSRVGAPYDAAWALLDSDDEIDVREARAMFEQLRAAVLVARCDDKLRAMGARVPRGARASTRSTVGGLTDREVEGLELLDEGLRNAEIAARLHLSEKTVGHHVSSILTKLGAASRTEAVRKARDLAAVG